MNNSSFLSDNINFNNQFVIQSKQTFISENYQEKINKNCVVKSATSKKWSIKFK